jgi:hypothetical protein
MIVQSALTFTPAAIISDANMCRASCSPIGSRLEQLASVERHAAAESKLDVNSVSTVARSWSSTRVTAFLRGYASGTLLGPAAVSLPAPSRAHRGVGTMLVGAGKRACEVWRRREEVWAYFNNDWRGFAPANARGPAKRLSG